MLEVEEVSLSTSYNYVILMSRGLHIQPAFLRSMWKSSGQMKPIPDVYQKLDSAQCINVDAGIQRDLMCDSI